MQPKTFRDDTVFHVLGAVLGLCFLGFGAAKAVIVYRGGPAMAAEALSLLSCASLLGLLAWGWVFSRRRMHGYYRAERTGNRFRTFLIEKPNTAATIISAGILVIGGAAYLGTPALRDPRAVPLAAIAGGAVLGLAIFLALIFLAREKPDEPRD